MFYWSGPWPYDPLWGYSGYGGYSGTNDSADCCCFAGICRPVGWLLWVFPVMPENMWGGLIGALMGTRLNTRPDREYQGGNALIDFLGMRFRRTNDLHSNESWRYQVWEYLATDPQPNTDWSQSGSPHRGNLQYQVVQQAQAAESLRLALNEGSPVRIGNTQVVPVNRTFSESQDSPVGSSWEDYKSNKCWICQDSRAEWDMWLSCHHLFCEKCSTEMLKRRMPCPLCRVTSTAALRGKAFTDCES